MHAGKNQAASAQTDQAKRFFGIAGCHRFITHIGDDVGKSVAFRRIIVKNAWG